MSTPSRTSRAAAAASELADEALQGAEQAIESTRTIANDSLDRASGKVRDLRRETNPAVERLAATAEQLIDRGLNYYADTSTRARREIARYADASGRYVSSQPMKSMLVAAATGAVIAGALLYALRDKHRNRY